VENRRLFLAILLSILVIVGWQYLIRPPTPPPEAPDRSGAEDVAEGGSTAGEAVQPEEEQTAEPESREAERTATPPEAVPDGGPETPPEPATVSPPVEETTGPPIEGAAEQRVVMETERVRVELTNRGGQVVSFLLKEHQAREGGPVDLVRARREGPYPFGLADRNGASHPLNEALFETERLDDGGVRYRYRGPSGEATKTFRFRPSIGGKIRDLLEVEIEVPGEDGWSVVLGPGLRNPSEKERKASYFARRRGVYNVGGEVEAINAQKVSGPQPVPGTGDLRWVGLDDNYFLTVVLFDPRGGGQGGALLEPMLPLPGDEGVDFEPVADVELLPEDQKDLERELRVRVEPGPEGFHGIAYWGAKRLEVLSALTIPGTGGAVPAELDHTIELGFLRIIADPLLRGLHWIHQRVVANYGWAIVLMTLLLKILLLPLTHKSYSSMRKMQEIQPKMEALRAKYRPKLKDKQGRPNMEAQRKMNEEMMALFKQEGVNPAGGCLPMLLQMPFFFSFYFILREAVELRNAAWLWVPDLSAPEPTGIHVLPLIMTVTQFLQQRMTPMAGDPMQRRLFQLLPFFFLVLFWGMPSGLVLYWLTNNVLTIAQQSIYNHLKKRGGSSDKAGRTEKANARGKDKRHGQAK
jgi:YidC/Oxa1 family membrane protein insertase